MKKAQPNFLQTTRTPEIILTPFYDDLDDFFSAFIDKLSECRIL